MSDRTLVLLKPDAVERGLVGDRAEIKDSCIVNQHVELAEP